MVERGRLKGEDKIGVRVGKVINKYKVAKHFILDIEANRFAHSLDEDKIATEASLDGLYVIRTGLDKQRISAEDAVRNYKRLSNVERAFRSMKTMHLHIRSIHHHLSTIVRNECKILGADAGTPHFKITTKPNAKQQRAYELLKTIAV